jgi:hypothetical protein
MSDSREELLAARAKLERQIDELSYRSIIGGLTPSGKPALLERLKGILAQIDQELAEMDR